MAQEPGLEHLSGSWWEQTHFLQRRRDKNIPAVTLYRKEGSQGVWEESYGLVTRLVCWLTMGLGGGSDKPVRGKD